MIRIGTHGEIGFTRTPRFRWAVKRGYTARSYEAEIHLQLGSFFLSSKVYSILLGLSFNC